MNPYNRFTTPFGGKELIIETGVFAQNANGAVTVTYGETVVLATAVMGKGIREGIDYFPLTIDYDERFYAAGRIKGSRWMKREGRPTDVAILTDRLIDRALRPLFNQSLRQEVQIVTTILSFDEENDPDIVALIAASTALAISDIPWDGPIGGVRIGMVDEKMIINPSYKERGEGIADIVVAGTKERINMIEAKAKEIPEEKLIDMIAGTQEEIKRIIEFQENIVSRVGKKSIEITLPERDIAFEEDVRKFLGKQLEESIFGLKQYDHMEKANELKRLLGDYIAEKYAPSRIREAYQLFEEEVNAIVHDKIIREGRRPDGRTQTEIRDISCSVGVLPRTHGSGVFQRGQTQALSVLTLGAPGAELYIEEMEFVGKKRFMHHYNFPPFSTGEIGRLGAPGRREIGHGSLAERALESLIPPNETFPYTIRIVSEILSSNGSSSMAAVCGSSLALMDAGIPIKRPAAGIAMGLMMHNMEQYSILTDIQGPEDHHGDMDLKVAGTSEGVTAIQMDVKIEGVTPRLLSEAFSQAKEARMKILEKMLTVIPESRKELSSYAPRVISIKINPDRIKDVIGPGGKMIHEITEKTGVDIDIEDSGLVYVTSKNEESASAAVTWIKNITREIAPGELFSGKTVRIVNFGAFIEILPGQQGLLHASEILSDNYGRIEDVIKVGDIVPVKVREIDSQGRINLIMNNGSRRVSSPHGASNFRQYGKRNPNVRSRRPVF